MGGGRNIYEGLSFCSGFGDRVIGMWVVMRLIIRVIC